MRLDSVNRSNLKMIVIVILAIFVIQYFFPSSTSMYKPASVDIQAVSEEPLTGLKSGPECAGGVYSTSLGGVCGAQDLVRAHASYKMV
jgi:hypothetical protein|tara:strand:+ start:373 stop:636 length:264 start_codon:yes stop_codon:yes gene_type:complete